MIDPIFSDRTSPIQLVGPKRFRPPPCKISELPHINAVLISHDHYDHLDQNTLNELFIKDSPIFLVGMGSEDVMPKKSKPVLLDWMAPTTIVINGR